MELLFLLILALTPVSAPPAQAISCARALESQSHSGPRCAVDMRAERVTAASQLVLGSTADAPPE